MATEYEYGHVLTIDEAIEEIQKSRGNAQAKRMAIFALKQLKENQGDKNERCK